MSPRDVPGDDEAREIFLVALARMSAACQPPNLISACPFSVDLPTGGRGCGEECEEILNAHGRGPDGEIALGDMTLIPRPRISGATPREAEPLSKAFDATETYYLESEDPDVRTWSPTTLLVSCRRATTTHPSARSPASHRELEASIAELRRRGFDVEGIFTGPIADLVWEAIVSDVVERLERDKRASNSSEVDNRLAIFQSLFAAHEASGAEQPAAHLDVISDIHLDDDMLRRIRFAVAGGFGRKIFFWSRSASFDDLISWNVVDDVHTVSTGEITTSGDETSIWIFDRFTQTYLNEWSASSLRMEWRFRRGNLDLSPSLADQMMVRMVDIGSLAALVADLDTDSNRRSVRDDHLVRHAVRMLRSGKREAAGALFDAVRLSDWEDAELHNNYGFCVLPDDPAKALGALNQANRLGFTGAVNRANRALCLWRLGRTTAALDILEQAREDWGELRTDDSYLWDLDSKEPRLTLQCPRCYLIKLGAQVAAGSGDSVVAERWRNRVERLQHQDA